MENNFAKDIKQIIDWLKYLLSKWLIIGIVSILIGVLGIYYAYKDKPKYESNLTFALEDGGDGALSGALSLAAEFGLSVGGGQSIFAGENIIEIIRSRKIIERTLLTVDTLDNQPITLANWYLKINKPEKPEKKNKYAEVSFPVNQPRETFSYLQDTVLLSMKDGIIKNHLDIGKPDKRLNIFQINFRSFDERFSMVFTKNLLKETTDYYTEIKTKRSKQTLDVLENRVAHMKGNVNTAVTERLVIQDANINPAFLKAQVPVQLKQVDAEAYGSAYAELFKNLELARIQYLKEIPLLQVIDDVQYPMKRIKLGKAKNAITFGLVTGILMSILFSIIYFLKKMKIFKNEIE